MNWIFIHAFNTWLLSKVGLFFDREGKTGHIYGQNSLRGEQRINKFTPYKALSQESNLEIIGGVPVLSPLCPPAPKFEARK